MRAVTHGVALCGDYSKLLVVFEANDETGHAHH